MQVGGLERVGLEARPLGEAVFHRHQRITRLGVGPGEDEHRELPTVDVFLHQQFVVLHQRGAHFRQEGTGILDERLLIDAEAVAGVRGLDEERERQAIGHIVRVLHAAHQPVGRCLHVGRVGDVLHERLGRIIEMRRWSRVRQIEQVERLNHVDRRHVPVEIPFAEVDENVVTLAGQVLELLVGGEFVERNVVHRVLRQQRGEIAGWVVVLIVDRGRGIVRKQHTDLHDTATGASGGLTTSASSMISLITSRKVRLANRRMAPMDV